MKTLLVMFLCSLVATSSFALLDPNDDSIGVYFDLDGDVVCAPGYFNSIVSAYVFYTNPTVAAIRGFEAEITMANDSGPMAPIWFPITFPVPGSNIGNNGNIIVGYSAPIPTSTVTLIATISWFNLEFGTTHLFIGPSVPSSNNLGLPSIFKDDFLIMPVGMSSLPGTSCAQLNGVECMVVENEELSFGGVKALYR